MANQASGITARAARTAPPRDAALTRRGPAGGWKGGLGIMVGGMHGAQMEDGFPGGWGRQMFAPRLRPPSSCAGGLALTFCDCADCRLPRRPRRMHKEAADGRSCAAS